MASVWRKARCRSASRNSTRRRKSARRVPRSPYAIDGAIEVRSAPRSERTSPDRINKRFCCVFLLAFALIGVPLGITTHRRETTIGFLMALVIGFSYFVFWIVADTLRKDLLKVHPELLVRFRLLFLALGAFLFYRLSKR